MKRWAGVWVVSHDGLGSWPLRVATTTRPLDKAAAIVDRCLRPAHDFVPHDLGTDPAGLNRRKRASGAADRSFSGALLFDAERALRSVGVDFAFHITIPAPRWRRVRDYHRQ